MSGHAADRAFPKLPLLGVAGLLGVTLGVAFIGGTPALEHGVAVQQRDLVFEDRADGAVTVRDAQSSAPFAVIDPGTNGFMRAALRGLARERLREAHGPEVPFRLVTWQDGRMTLDDPATGRRIDIKAFGPSQAEAFARLLTREGNQP